MEQLLLLILPTLIATLVGGVAKIVLDIYENSNIKRQYYNRSWRCKTRKGSFSSYANFIIFCFLSFIFILVFSYVIFAVLYFSELVKEHTIPVFITGLILYIILILIINVIIAPKKRLINYKKKEVSRKLAIFLIWNLPLLGSLLTFVFICFDSEYTSKMYMGLLLILIMEIWGGFYLDNDIAFQYKKIKLILEDNSIISNINSETFCVKEKWFVGICSTYKEDKEIRVPQEKVIRIEYYDKQF
ncbi:MAG: hypothetical protein J1E83_10430 [Lachnospiraceae bacterium]|nr:hypothetical protein [Lachnospiraceae bacterium]